VDLITLSEIGRGVQRRLTPDQANLLADSGIVRVSSVRGASDMWQVQARNSVGSVRVGAFEIHISPKIPVKRIFFLLGYAASRAHWRVDTIPLPEAEDLVPAFAQPLWRQSMQALRLGILQGYREQNVVSTVLRGRLRETDQLYRHCGLQLPLQIRYDDFTVDIVENQILRTALGRMLNVPRVDDESRRMIQHLLGKLAGITPLSRGTLAPVWTPSRLNARYHAALRLAELVLRATSVEHGPGGVAVNGFLVDMEDVFEDFVRVALTEELTQAQVRCQPKRTYHLDETRRLKLTPDLVWEREGRPIAVVDAKYKPERQSRGGGPSEDLYQILAYCTILGLRSGHLVYAKGHGEPTRYVVCRAGIEIMCHALDLDQSPKSLMAQIQVIAAAIAAT